MISGKPPWPIFVHGPPIPLTVAGGHQVNFAATRPVWVAHAPGLNAAEFGLVRAHFRGPTCHAAGVHRAHRRLEAHRRRTGDGVARRELEDSRNRRDPDRVDRGHRTGILERHGRQREGTADALAGRRDLLADADAAHDDLGSGMHPRSMPLRWLRPTSFGRQHGHRPRTVPRPDMNVRPPQSFSATRGRGKPDQRNLGALAAVRGELAGEGVVRRAGRARD